MQSEFAGDLANRKNRVPVAARDARAARGCASVVGVPSAGVIDEVLYGDVVDMSVGTLVRQRGRVDAKQRKDSRAQVESARVAQGVDSGAGEELAATGDAEEL